ncbi:MAG TPA: isoprenylcysteine carboxylmethyltransferase family protein [Vicinamibacterales bacterium]|nr:isoprenylcysteine carboxylmethyltransferase family protein [Vicinamibacterales bacterium]
MADDSLFRWIVVAGFVATVAIALPHRIRAGTRERLDRRKEGMFILATLRPAGAALWMGVIAYMLNPSSMAWSAVALPPALRWSGALLTALGILLTAWTMPTLGRNLTDTVVTREEHTLVTRGPYRWIRHPFYVSMAFVSFGAALLAANWFIFAFAVAVFGLLAVRSRVEEEQLALKFGQAYRDYQERTGRFLPKM